jgi:hypothetical protein
VERALSTSDRRRTRPRGAPVGASEWRRRWRGGGTDWVRTARNSPWARVRRPHVSNVGFGSGSGRQRRAARAEALCITSIALSWRNALRADRLPSDAGPALDARTMLLNARRLLRDWRKESARRS